MTITVRDYIEQLLLMPQDAKIIVNFHSDWHLAGRRHLPMTIEGRVHLGNDDIVTTRPARHDFNHYRPDLAASEREANDRHITGWEADSEHKGPIETFVAIGY